MPEIHDAKAFLASGKYVKAETLLSRAQDIAKYAVGEKSLPYAELVALNARCKFFQSKFLESANFCQQAMQTYLKLAEFSSMRDILPLYTLAVLRLPHSTEKNSFFAFTRGIGVTADPALNVTVSTCKIQLISVCYHDERLKNMNTAMEALEHEISGLIASTELDDLPQDSLIVSRWHLTVGRWYQSLYDMRRDEETHKKALQAYTFVSSASAGLKSKPTSQNEGQSNSEGGSVDMKDKNDDREFQLVRADALLGLGDLARIQEKWEEADEHYKVAIDITDRFFDRDSTRVRHIMEREAVVQFNLKRWLHSEGLLRRLLDYYTEHKPLNGDTCQRGQYECLSTYIQLLEARGRGSEVATLKTQIQAITTILPPPAFDPYAF